MKRAVYNIKESIEEKEENRKKIKSIQKKALRKRTELVSKEELIVISVLIHL